MSNPNRHGSHSVTRLTVHLVWVTKYRYHVLKGDVQQRCRELLIQICDAQDIVILKGAVGIDHVHMHLEYAPKLSISEIMKSLKGRSSALLQEEFPELKKRYWGNHFWATGFGAWSTGNVTEELIQKYIAGHKDSPNDKALIIE